ncbi:MAG: bifunctional glutamate N-acetyltransferase/amino-acid acetyltransferase ArgJ [Oscillospiraceae bacterium]
MKFTPVTGGVCAAKGFTANGVHCGLVKDPDKNDLGMVFCEAPCATAAVYTRNKVMGAPILVTKKNLAATGGISRAVIVNSKNANTCNADGEEKAAAMCALAAQQLSIAPEEVIVASTGVIGQVLPIEPIAGAMEALAKGLSKNGNAKATNAIMTTDTIPKEYAVAFEIGGVTCTVGGMAKGSGMIHPNMATTLNFITTDAAISPALLQKALSKNVKITYNCLSIDRDTSTNDMVSVMASGLAGNAVIAEENADYAVFEAALFEVMLYLTKLLAKDGEGATKLIECVCTGAPDDAAATAVAKSIICSPLFKCMIFGEDANCGRILCAIGYTDAEFDISKVAVFIGSKAGQIQVGENGSVLAFSEEEAKKILTEDEITVTVAMNQGAGKATAWGCDLTYEYVKINGDYRS